VDIDLAIVLRSADVPALLAALGPEFYVDEGAMRHAGLSRILARADIHEAS